MQEIYDELSAMGHEEIRKLTTVADWQATIAMVPPSSDTSSDQMVLAMLYGTPLAQTTDSADILFSVDENVRGLCSHLMVARDRLRKPVDT